MQPYILNNITISRYCCFYWRTFVIIYLKMVWLHRNMSELF